jgi:hypothetical protein
VAVEAGLGHDDAVGAVHEPRTLLETPANRRDWCAMPLPTLRSPVARAVVPVLAGMAFIALLFGILWLAAVILSRNADDLDVRLGDEVFEVGRIDRLANEIEERGPLLFPGLVGPAGERPVGLDHTGDNDVEGWRVFHLQPAGAPAGCLVTRTKRPARSPTVPACPSPLRTCRRRRT